jgi:HK97 family phage prohead protease
MPGAFRHQLKAADKVVGNYEHIQGPQGLVARATDLREEADGYHATFRMLDGSDADKTLELIREGVLDGVSIEAQPVKNSRSPGGVVQRLRANLRAVAFTRFAAYSGARVLAVREELIEDEVFIDPSFLPLTLNPGLVDRCRRAGITLPQRYQAHPAETGTPAEAGTPEDGTRHAT